MDLSVGNDTRAYKPINVIIIKKALIVDFTSSDNNQPLHWMDGGK